MNARGSLDLTVSLAPTRETSVTKPPETERVLLASLSLSGEGGGDEVRPLMLMIFYMLDRIKRLRLSKEVRLL